MVPENLVQTSLFLSIIISLGNVKGTDKSVASVFLCEARCLLFKSLFAMYAAFRYSLSENHLYFMYFMFSLFSQDQNNSLLHFVAFFHVASLFSTGVDNRKVGVDNKKALELTNSTVFHRGRQ